MSLANLRMENPLGLPILPHLRRQISSCIGDYSGKPSSLYLRQARQSLSLGVTLAMLFVWPFFFPSTCPALEAGELLVVANRNAQGSIGLARYYMDKRGEIAERKDRLQWASPKTKKYLVKRI